MNWGGKTGTLINYLRGCLDVGFPSVPELFRETKMRSIPSPALQPQQIPVTCHRHALKKNRPPATETSALPHTYQHTNYFCHLQTRTLLCLCPISTLSSEIRNFYYDFSFPFLFLMAEWNPRKQNKTHPHTANILQNDGTSWLHFKPSPRSHSADQHKLTRAGPHYRSLNSPNVTSPTSWTPKNLGLHQDSVPLQAAYTNPPSSQTPDTVTRLWRNTS